MARPSGDHIATPLPGGYSKEYSSGPPCTEATFIFKRVPRLPGSCQPYRASLESDVRNTNPFNPPGEGTGMGFGGPPPFVGIKKAPCGSSAWYVAHCPSGEHIGKAMTLAGAS